jgi:hypothetical protein
MAHPQVVKECTMDSDSDGVDRVLNEDLARRRADRRRNSRPDLRMEDRRASRSI